MSDKPDHLKFGYAAMIERAEIRRRLINDGADPNSVALHFAVEKEYDTAHASDPTYRETTQRLMAQWGPGARRQQEAFAQDGEALALRDAALAALRQIAEGHNDPRTLAREVLALFVTTGDNADLGCARAESIDPATPPGTPSRASDPVLRIDAPHSRDI